MTDLLCEISRATDAKKQVLLSAVVVRAVSGLPGEGFFAFAAERSRDVDDPDAAWQLEVGRVYAVYGTSVAESS